MGDHKLAYDEQITVFCSHNKGLLVYSLVTYLRSGNSLAKLISAILMAVISFIGCVPNVGNHCLLVLKGLHYPPPLLVDRCWPKQPLSEHAPMTCMVYKQLVAHRTLHGGTDAVPAPVRGRDRFIVGDQVAGGCLPAR
jgi:hypothetical protein